MKQYMEKIAIIHVLFVLIYAERMAYVLENVIRMLYAKNKIYYVLMILKQGQNVMKIAQRRYLVNAINLIENINV